MWGLKPLTSVESKIWCIHVPFADVGQRHKEMGWGACQQWTESSFVSPEHFSLQMLWRSTWQAAGIDTGLDDLSPEDKFSSFLDWGKKGIFEVLEAYWRSPMLPIYYCTWSGGRGHTIWSLGPLAKVWGFNKPWDKLIYLSNLEGKPVRKCSATMPASGVWILQEPLLKKSNEEVKLAIACKELLTFNDDLEL